MSGYRASQAAPTMPLNARFGRSTRPPSMTCPCPPLCLSARYWPSNPPSATHTHTHICTHAPARGPTAKPNLIKERWCRRGLVLLPLLPILPLPLPPLPLLLPLLPAPPHFIATRPSIHSPLQLQLCPLANTAACAAAPLASCRLSLRLFDDTLPRQISARTFLATPPPFSSTHSFHSKSRPAPRALLPQPNTSFP